MSVYAAVLYSSIFWLQKKERKDKPSAPFHSEFGVGYNRNITQSNEVVIITTAYGNDILNISPQLISSFFFAKAEVKKNKNAACPFGVNTLKILVPAFILTVKLSRCFISWSVNCPSFTISIAASIKILATKTLSLTDDSRPLIEKKKVRWSCSPSVAAKLIAGINVCCSCSIATKANNTPNTTRNGPPSSNAGTKSCSSFLPVVADAKIIMTNPIKPTSAKWVMSIKTNNRATTPCIIRDSFSVWFIDCMYWFLHSMITSLSSGVITFPKPNSLNFSRIMVVVNPANSVGTVTGSILMKNVWKSQSGKFACVNIVLIIFTNITFCGSPTIVITPPSAVPISPWIIIDRRNCL